MRRITAVLLLLLAASCTRRSDLPELYPLPQVTLITEKGSNVDLRTLNGTVTVYDFIFTRCPGTCPLLTKKLQKLTKMFDAEEKIRFASLSVDPAHDTPPVLARYAAANRNDPRWSFYTGEHGAVRTLSVDGFKLAAMDGGSTTEPIVHSTKFVLVDKKGVIRGYYDAMDDTSLTALVRDARGLIEE